MERLSVKLIEARQKLDEFNLIVAEFRVRNGMSDELRQLYRNMGKYGQNLDLLIDEAAKLNDDYKIIYEKGDTK